MYADIGLMQQLIKHIRQKQFNANVQCGFEITII